MWERDSYSAVRLETAETILEKIVYVLANPVAAGLVRRGSDWPGLWSDPTLVGGEGVVLEPKIAVVCLEGRKKRRRSEARRVTR